MSNLLPGDELLDSKTNDVVMSVTSGRRVAGRVRVFPDR
jgi:hypothetical protein